MLIDTYIIRLYRHEVDKVKANEVIGVVEVADQEKKLYFTRLEELPVILNQLSHSKVQPS
jgi:NurA-like 5'-3' nuclease